MFEIGNQIFQLVLSLFFSSIIVITFLFFLKPFIKKRFSKRWQYYIWLIVLLRLLVPIAFEIKIPQKLITIENQSQLDKQISNLEIENNKTDIFLENIKKEEEKQKFHYWNYIWIIWVIGIIFISVIKIVNYRNFIHYIKINNHKVTDEKILKIFDDVTIQQKIDKEISLYQNPLIVSPMLVGIFHTFIVIPEKEILEKDMFYIFQRQQPTTKVEGL